MESQPSPIRDMDIDLAASEDMILSDLSQTEAHFRTVLVQAQQKTEALREAQAQLAGLQRRVAGLEETNTQLTKRLLDSRSETEQERLRVEAEQDKRRVEQARSQQLEIVLRDLHQTFFTGNVYALILKASLAITGATRGVYVTTSGEGSPLRIRAAIDVDGYPQSAPSDFLKGLCQQALQAHDTFVAHSEADLQHLPQPAAPTEHFHNCIVAPVAMKKSLNGIVVAADKLNGNFDDGDVQSIMAVGNQAGVVAENSQLRRRLQDAYMGTVAVMADAMEAKDSYTQGHSEMVSRLARLTARHLNLSDMDRSIVSYAALLHDIGKIGVSDGLLNKPGPLLPEEREMVRAHVRLGYDLIQHVPALHPVATAVLHHHECFDGSGYPNGLKGDEIPIAARIVCVVDSYSAMISKRSYKDAYSEEWARGELSRCAGIQFDPQIVEAFLYVLSLPDLSQLDDDEEEELEWLPAFHTASEASEGAPLAHQSAR